MAVFHRNESETSTLRAIDAPGADNPTNPIRLGGLADLEANQDFWSSSFAQLCHVNGKDY